jgi:hypothetical protein
MGDEWLADSGSMLRTSLTRRGLLAGAAGALGSGATFAPGTSLLAAPLAEFGPTPDSPAVEQLTWLVERLNGAPITEDDILERFYPELIFHTFPSGTTLPPAEAVRRIRSVGKQLAPVKVDAYWMPPTGEIPGALFPIIKARRDTYQMDFFFEPEAPYRIFSFQLYGLTPGILEDWPLSPVVWKNWAEFDRRSAANAPISGVLAQELDGGRPRTIHRRLSEVQLEIGSIFKLYVLGALARAIEEGEAAWGEPLAVRDGWKSLNGITWPPAGVEFTLLDYAALMIEFSDNTATDHLLLHLGRKRVEAMLEPMGHRQPWRNRPFLSTREYFALNIALSPKRAAAYARAREAKQRRLLEEEILGTDIALVQALDWVDPRNHWTIGWFASLGDMTRAILALDEMSRRPGLEPVRDILALPPSFLPYQADLSVWPYIGNKGGSVPGAQCFVWLLERDDGKRFTLAIGHNHPRKTIDYVAPYVAYAGALGLLARTGREREAGDGAARNLGRLSAADGLRGTMKDPDPRRSRIP